MRYIKIIFTITILAPFFNSCDKVTNPIKPAVNLDTNIFPGNWNNDYPEITWDENSNSNRNVILEDYTGHRCPNCPTAATIAEGIEDGNPSRVFVSSVHASPGGLSDFQNTASDCGLASNPYDKYCTEFYNNESITYGSEFQAGFGFFANPLGTVNRITPDASEMFSPSSQWATRTSDILTTNDLKINIQAQSNYYSSTNGFFLHVETEMLEELSSEYNLVVYLIENEVIDWQDDNGTADEFYHHHNVFRGCIDGLAWGRPLSGGIAEGDKTYLDYTYSLPSGSTNNDYHLLIYAYDLATYEIMQVVKQEL